LTKPRQGQIKKEAQGAFRYVREFRLGNDKNEWAVGQQLTVDLFQDFELVDVIGISIGKGFQGGMKRWNWSGGPETHGSMSHRAPGASGSGTTPGRVYKGHHFPGHMGDDRVTIQNLRIIQRDAQNNLILVEGSVPGSEESLVLVRKSIKKPGIIRKPQVAQSVIDEEEDSKAKKAPAKKK
jgi:large subunit ribosomal protein L3